MSKISCYNRGCGQDYDPNNNPDDACRHHPGTPYFHDAYKGWSCCKKKSVDFTEFLNIKGCELSKHSNVKPVEPEKPEQNIVEEEPLQEIRDPIKSSTLERPSFDAPLTTLVPIVAPALKQSIDNLVVSSPKSDETNGTAIPIGTTCKYGGCNATYESPASDETECNYHPGVPIFHEGLKYWSCCTKRTTDFTAFMNQKGCAYGRHKWISDQKDSTDLKCRYDWHQTATNVVIAIYAKLYHYKKSTVKLNQVRLAVQLVFPQQDNAEFNLDVELRGIVDVAKAKVQMYGTKVEITLPKAEPGHWSNLDFPKPAPIKSAADDEPKQKPDVPAPPPAASGNDSDVDLEEIEPLRAVKISEA